jgi:hypothetical protein
VTSPSPIPRPFPRGIPPREETDPPPPFPFPPQDTAKSRNKVKLWFKDLDDTYRDALDRPRVEALLCFVHDDAHASSPPRASEVDWVMRKASLSAEDSSHSVLTLPECEDAVGMYVSYLKRRNEIDVVFQTYDRDDDDALNRAELGAYVRYELNHGDVPSDLEIDWLLEKLDIGSCMTSEKGDGLVGRTEIMRAKDEWCLMPDEVATTRHRRGDDDFSRSTTLEFSSPNSREPAGGCCVVM